MANTKNAKKAIKVQERRRTRNQIVKSQVKTSLRKANEEVKKLTSKNADGSQDSTLQETAQAKVVKAVSALDKAVAKGVLHRNQAGRKKSRLMKKLNVAL